MGKWNEQSRAAAETLERYILDTTWDFFPPEVKERAVTCASDLFITMILCSKTHMAQNGVRLAESVFPAGDIPVIGTETRLNMMGAVTAYGYTANALDIDDGHNLIKGHPGSVLAAGLLPAALRANSTYKEFLTALIVGYEVSIRAGLTLHRYYNYYHGTGSWGAFGVASGISKLLGSDRRILSNALGIADYQGPLAPVMRIVEIPSMNKDGIAWGAITGAMAVEAAMHGITGQFYNLLEPSFKPMLDSLGKEYLCMDLYFKYFPCCRWAQAAVMCALDLRKKYVLSCDEIESVHIHTFKAGTQLSSIKPVYSDEAQYNMVYPVCVALAEGKFIPEHVSEEYIAAHPGVVEMMDRVKFEVDDAMEAEFPQKRYARLEIIKTDGERLISGIHEPKGEAGEFVGLDWIADKFSNTAGQVFAPKDQTWLLETLSDADSKALLRDIIAGINHRIR